MTTRMRLRASVASWSLAVSLAGYLAILVGQPATGSAAVTSSTQTSSAPPPGFGNPLVVPGSPTEVEQAAAEKQAKLASPEAVVDREVSRTKFENLNTEQATKVDNEVVPAVINEPAGGPPKLPAGEKITGFPADNTAQVDLGGGRHGAIESSQPIALETSPGVRAPIDLSLTEAAGVFQPATPVVDVRISKRLGNAVQLAKSGVSLTPVDGTGGPLAGSEGAVDGAGVLYANTATDQDTFVKPTTAGFEADTLLRSVESPNQLYFRVGLPAGASLAQAKEGSETVSVMKEGVVIAVVSRPSARDAVGRSVPVSMSVSGDTIELAVTHRTGEYTYPVEVDPTVTDSAYEIGVYNGYEENWLFYNGSGSQFNGWWETGENRARDRMKISNNLSFTASEWAYFYYITKGASQIYKWYGKTESTESGFQYTDAQMYLWSEKSNSEKTYEGGPFVLPRTGTAEATVCALSGCAVPESIESGRAANGAFFQAYAENSYGNSHVAYSAGETSVSIVQYSGPWAGFDTTDQFIEGYDYQNLTEGEKWIVGLNPLYGGGRWVRRLDAIMGFEGTDPGVGVDRLGWYSPSEPSWGTGSANYGLVGKCKGTVQCNPCVGAQCTPREPVTHSLWFLPEGEIPVETTAWNGVGMSVTAKATVKIDNAAPYNISLPLPAGNEVGDGQNHAVKLRATATDGSGSVPSSGVASIGLAVDGKPLGSPSGACSPGPCSATSAQAIMNTEEYPAGKHTITVTATDNVGNVGSENFTLTIHHASPVAMGPGSVNPLTGEYNMSASDVSVLGPGAALSVSRSYSSRHLTSGLEGPLGPQWSMSVSGEQSIAKLPSGSIVLTNSAGRQTVFTSAGGGKFTSPTGDAAITLTETTIKGAAAFNLKSGSMTVTFTRPSGNETVWMPAITEGTGGTNASTFAFQAIEVEGKKITEPTEELAPVPAGVSCAPTLNKGCRALTFNYAKATTATGENPSEWGDYNGRLTRVYFTAWNPTKSEMTTSTIAQYTYDKQGRLRGQWNPLITPTQETTYGYDSGGRVTALTPPGQEPWAFNYGATTNDPSVGRLLSVTRPSAATALGNGIAPQNTVAPSLSTSSPVMGTALSVTNGTWTNSPISYGYQWQDCTGASCSAIPGAVNQSYTPVASDGGYALKAQVTATSAGGAITAATSVSSVVPSTVPTYASQFGSTGSGAGQMSGPGIVALDASNNAWVTDGNNRLDEFSPTGSFIAGYGFGVLNGENTYQTCTTTCRAGLVGAGNGEFNGPWSIAINQSTGDIYVTDQGNHRVQQFTSTGTFVRTWGNTGTGNGQFSTLAGITVDPSGNVWVADFGNNRVQEFTASGAYISQLGSKGTGDGQFENPVGMAFSGGNLYISDYHNNRIQEFGPAGGYIGQFGSTGSGIGQFSGPWSITSDPTSGDLYVGDNANNRVEEFNAAGTFLGQFGTVGTGNGQFNGTRGVTVGPAGEPFVVDGGNNRVEKWSPHELAQEPVPSPPALGTSAVWTMAYQVPISGSGAPYPMGAKEVETWGQKDLPTEATAIFPPDTPAGWPAADYKHASIQYLNSRNQAVNTVTPSGGISTSEHNATNDVVRTLTASNRQTALAEGSKSAEVSKLLDSESTYNAEGTELLSALGPQHSVGLTNGTQAQARESKHYYYDEGAPALSEGGPYHLVTKTTDAALVSGKEEDLRTTKTSYSGQGNLGWKLGKPTATTTDPGGLNLVHSVQYNPTTGVVTESRQPGSGTPGEEPGYSFAFQFGKEGSTEGQFKEPQAIAVNANGVYVLDTGNSRVQEFDTKGKWIRTFGALGTAEGQLKTPRGIAVDSTGNVWVADTGNSRVEEFSATGTYTAKITEGLKEPQGVAVSSQKEIWIADTGNSQIVRFIPLEKGSFLRFGKYGTRGAAPEQFNEPRGIAIGAGGSLYVADTGNNRIDKYTATITEVKFLRTFATLGTGNGQLKVPYGITTDSEGHVFVADTGNNRVQEFGSAGTFFQAFGKEGTLEGKFKSPKGVAIDTAGNPWIADTANNRVSNWTPTQGYEGAGAGTAHNQQTVYYSSAANPAYPACGERPEWASLPCQVQPAKQPTGGIGNLSVTTYTYNMWEQPEVTVETTGSATRTTTVGFDPAGRVKTKTLESTVGTALPKVTYGYNETTGSPETQSTTVEGKTNTIASVHNRLGQLESYTDADGNIATFKFDIDGRREKTSDGKGTQTFSYDSTTGFLTRMVDSAAGTFTASRDVEGNTLSEGYPNGMTAKDLFDATGQTIGLEYVKTTHCTEKCVWYSDSIVPSVHGQWLTQASTFSNQSYRYDPAERLTEVTDTPSGKGCTARLYGYDEETNRTSLTTREPGSEGKCATEGGATEKHTYDEANRLNDTGAVYNPFGDITKVPAADAGGWELTSSFYGSDKLASQTQNGETIGYNLDPAGRNRETVSTGKTASDIISHFAGAGDSPAWTVEEPSGHWSRNIPGIDGSLAAVQGNGEPPVLQLPNLHGDIIATAAVSETETKLLTTADTTEYGVPRTSTPAKYSWLGAAQRSTQLPSGIVAMGARSYVPQIGRFLEPDPVEGGSANAYAYTFGDPVNTSDPGGESTGTPPAWAIQAGAQVAEEAVARRAAEEAAARAEAERKIAEEEAAAAAYWAYWNSYSWVPHFDESATESEQQVTYGGCTGTRACTASICGTWPYCSSLTNALMHSRSPAAAKIRSSSCVVTFMGIRSTCQQVLERAKAEYGADNTHACSESISIVGGVVGGRYFGFLGGLIGDKVVGNAAGHAICE